MGEDNALRRGKVKVPQKTYRYRRNRIYTNTEFNYYETITVPREILSKEIGHFYFGIFDVLYLDEINRYIFNEKNGLCMTMFGFLMKKMLAAK